ncbi:MAG: tetratricopeptide repeat protein [Betaproteobacteria bacterium]|nr:tetratricopeptide repeat protein [Betaproteobacteria bacterium]
MSNFFNSVMRVRFLNRGLPYIALFCILALTGWVYSDGLKGWFVFDDFPNIVQNPAIAHAHFTFSSLARAAFSSRAGPLKRPLASLSFALQTAAFGLSPFALKLGNLIVHLLNGALIFLLVRKMLGAPSVQGTCQGKCAIWLPVVVAGAWLLAPINLTAVLYVVQRMESMSTLFMLLGLLSYVEGRLRLLRDRPNALLFTVGGLLGSLALAVLTKETGVMLMAYALVLEWVLFEFKTASGRTDHRIVSTFIVLALIPGIAGVAMTLPAAINGQAYAGRPFDLSERLLTEGRVLADYLHWIVAPSLGGLTLYHDDFRISSGWLSPPSTLAAWLFLGALLGFALWIKKHRPLIALGILFFFAGHALVSTYLPLELADEYRNYLPGVGIFLAAFAVLLGEPFFRNRSVLRVGIIAAVIAFYGFVTYLRAHIWSDPVRLAYFESVHHPASPRAAYELGSTLAMIAPSPKSVQFSDALRSFERAAQLPGAGLLPPAEEIILSSKNRLPVQPSWWSRMAWDVRAHPLSPQDVNALYALIECSLKKICTYDTRSLGALLGLAVDGNPDRADLVTLDANYEVNFAHDYTNGLALMQRALALNPQNADYWRNLISLQVAMGQLSQARVGIERLRELNHLGSETRAIRAFTASLEKCARMRMPGARHAS